ncbi:MAG: YbaB/EbfC family nucleoid-associated protein [Candidatus Aegiribacteria sp.]|nr:YbaB/EbfC family nucleoid-associated protein [Candidatus Aegiribacteria sp.]
MDQKQLRKMMAQAQKMQNGMQQIQEELEDARIEGTAADGLVKAVVTGQGELVELNISKDAVDPDDIEMLEDLVLVAVKKAVSESQKLSRSKMEALGIPGIGGMM